MNGIAKARVSRLAVLRYAGACGWLSGTRCDTTICRSEDLLGCGSIAEGGIDMAGSKDMSCCVVSPGCADRALTKSPGGGMVAKASRLVVDLVRECYRCRLASPSSFHC